MSLSGVEISKGATIQLRQKQMVAWMVWGNLTISLLILAFVAYQVISKPSSTVTADDISSQIYLFPWLGALLLFVSRVVFTRFTSDERIKKVVESPSPPVKTGRSNLEISAQEGSALQAVQAAIQGMIISLALSEAASILGFILTIQSKQISYMVPFLAASFMLNVLNRPPTKSVWERALTAAHLAR